MHEMTLAQGVLDAIEQAARREDFAAVVVIRLEIGHLAAVDVTALRTALAVVLRGSLAAAARIEMIEVAGAGVCSRCGMTSAMTEVPAFCPACEGALRVTAGSGMRVLDLEVE